jgi:hypothetical protein
VRQLSCAVCRKSVDESQSAWDRAAATGACPFCGRFYRDETEEQSRSIAETAEFKRWARRWRWSALGVLLFCLGVGVRLMTWDFLRAGWLVVTFGIVWAYYGIFFRRQSVARELIRRGQYRKREAGRESGPSDV